MPRIANPAPSPAAAGGLDPAAGTGAADDSAGDASDDAGAVADDDSLRHQSNRQPSVAVAVAAAVEAAAIGRGEFDVSDEVHTGLRQTHNSDS